MDQANPPNPHTLDFDRFWADLHAGDPAAAAPVVMQVAGKAYPLPATLPAILVLARMRGETRTTAELFQAGDAIFGRAALDEWARAGWNAGRIVSAVLAAERLILGESPDEVMASATERGAEKKPRASTSSATGRGSKRRSSSATG